MRFEFNKHNVCLNPEIAYRWEKDRHNYVTIKVAQHPRNGLWGVGYDCCNNTNGFSGACSGASVDPLKIGGGYDTRHEAISANVAFLLGGLGGAISAEGLAALRAYAPVLGVVQPGDQLDLFAAA